MSRLGLTIFQRLSAELAGMGLLRNEPWVEQNAAEAEALFTLKDCQIIGVMMASVHRYGLDYLKQAPVLASAYVSRGSVQRAHSRKLVAQRLSSLLSRGPKLRELMAEFQIPYQYRVLSPFVSERALLPTLRATMDVNSSTLAQSIPKLRERQLSWLENLHLWATHARIRYRNDRLCIDWAVRNVADARHLDVTTVVDYVGANPLEFNEQWGWDKALEQANVWHATLAARSEEEKFQSQYGIGWTDNVDYGELPVECEIDGYRVVALRSGSALYDEGRVMHHCVASYAGGVVNGSSRIFSVRDGDSRVGTFELHYGRHCGYTQAQARGHCNAAIPRKVSAAIGKFVRQINGEK